jgi:hypothetical protein
MMISGEISVLNGIFPAMKTTDPYSPSALAKERAKPVNIAGINSGKMILMNVCIRFAPKEADASSIPFSIFSSTG